MPYKITIASGKGGTGKTTVAITLFTLLNEALGEKIELLDCDVEEPNDLIFFQDYVREHEEKITRLIPVINKESCSFCRDCVNYCEFNAIVVIPHLKFAEVNKSLCHSCGACRVACSHDAITEYPEPIGTVNTYKLKNERLVKEGRLKIGSAMQTMLIKELRKRTDPENEVVIHDAPPGTSCAVVETVSDADYVLLVAEPTLFGLHDLQLMVSLLKEIHKAFGVVINKAGLGDKRIYNYLEEEDVEILGEIPFSKDYASLYAKGSIIDKIPDKIRSSYESIIKSLTYKFLQYEGDNYFKW